MNLTETRRGTPGSRPRLTAYAWVVAGAVVFLLAAGAMVTSTGSGLAVPDWPLSFGQVMPPMEGGVFYEHGHRMVATGVGLLTIILAVWIWRADSRCWLRWLGLAALGAIILQGALGGLTVLFLLPKPVSISHASLAQLFFCTVVSIALFTSRWWLSEQAQLDDPASPAVRTLAALTAGSIFFQLVLGAAFRHQAVGILPHIFWAVVVMAMVVVVSRAVRQRFPVVAALRRPATILSALVGTQILLGVATFFAVLAARDFPQPPLFAIALTVAHVLVGALALATSVVMALCSFRLVPRATPAESLDASALRERAR
jgi:cytochrome c oxidase assembly protein subunit 15